MTKFFRSLVLGATGASFVLSGASAETLQEALLKAYETNPTLAAQRAGLRATDENVPIERANALPNVQLQSQHSENVVLPLTSFIAPSRIFNTAANLTVPIYSGGAVKNGIAAAQTRIEGGRASLRGTEADLFTNVVAAYMDVIRDEAIVDLNGQNVKVLDVNLQASRDRFQVGDLTRTDVAQSEARLALAISQLETAQSRLIASRESYIRFVGAAPGDLVTPPPLPNLPADPNAAVALAVNENPSLLAAKKAREATRFDVGSARATRLPRLEAFSGANYTQFLDTLGGRNAANFPQFDRTAQVGLRLTVPIYQGGGPSARIRQAQSRETQSVEQVTEAERAVIAQTRSAFAAWQSSLEVIKSSQVAVSANRLALEGVKAENSVGNRTILEILNAEQELLNSQVTLVTAQRDAYVAGFALLAAMGHAEAKDLRLEGGPLYDPAANYRRSRAVISDWAGRREPPPTGTSTAKTPAQGAEITRRADPARDTPIDSPRPNRSGIAPKN